ncbi:MAG: hypothetical protein CO186_10715 [Zetaproteobacteria bacterium CG_4_9_14_3_um_filter_49_83]|nr:MAG: hypothetical protein AUJ56_09535 [Zetaproteobacteria bacterium CG1_02_49_23]PIQ30691.1 MAG: hypothetical protein COW62_11670 [Zetaproteobacteria bacterium CG17_big_fil_post_rev_8_21_14_2_50_50_13]PIV29172.1 MAG: hypothetical protein COS35_13480 [Zetaproteobacteria bacterium CG02_land_8_20_14_3_00_50_9]PIY57182.1 MAG: hypothetical protein COZ00_00350 [Zetaproteobacteria bacterium CG_4_10_14_0_8_um_filter_49_80]PJA34457.1 MAG: hypothetical protein CO186_10715 [Zetaproteobacteria bacterium
MAGKIFTCIILLIMMMVASLPAQADEASKQVYDQAVQLASQGDQHGALTALQAAGAVLPQQDHWKQRMSAAALLLSMRMQHLTTLSMQFSAHDPNLALAQGYMAAHQAPLQQPEWPVAILATLLPGAGHAWLGRWHDAAIAALMVWPMLLLTLWALWRSMGPVTVFFALISMWLWSGTVFSAVSLQQRGFSEAYTLWWQGLWQASALPGVPW